MAEELYTGPHFETVFLGKEAPDCEKIEKLMQWCALFHQQGLAPAHESGTAGNLSFRIKEGENAFCITGAGLQAKCRLQNSDFVEVSHCDTNLMKVFARGTRLPSSESLMHFAVYEHLPHVHAVFHGHHEGLLQHAFRLQIPTTEIECGYGSVKLVESIHPMLGKYNFFIIKNHGFLSLGKDMEEAGNLAVEYVSKTENMDIENIEESSPIVHKRNSKNYFSLPSNDKLRERAKALRKARNLSEVLLWNQLKRKQFLGLDFDRQKIIGNYIVDFYCANCNVVIEIDGSSHDDKQEYDARRDAYLNCLGLTVIHITDVDVKKHMEATMRFLHDHAAFADWR